MPALATVPVQTAVILCAFVHVWPKNSHDRILLLVGHLKSVAFKYCESISPFIVASGQRVAHRGTTMSRTPPGQSVVLLIPLYAPMTGNLYEGDYAA